MKHSAQSSVISNKYNCMTLHNVFLPHTHKTHFFRIESNFPYIQFEMLLFSFDFSFTSFFSPFWPSSEIRYGLYFIQFNRRLFALCDSEFSGFSRIFDFFIMRSYEAFYFAARRFFRFYGLNVCVVCVASQRPRIICNALVVSLYLTLLYSKFKPKIEQKRSIEKRKPTLLCYGLHQLVPVVLM